MNDEKQNLMVNINRIHVTLFLRMDYGFPVYIGDKRGHIPCYETIRLEPGERVHIANGVYVDSEGRFVVEAE